MIQTRMETSREARTLRVVGVGDLQVSRSRSEILATYSLGSCVGLAAYDAITGVAGLLHAMLPQASLDLAKAKMRPGMFVDSGFDRLLRAMAELGADVDRLCFRLAGGASILDGKGIFRIGDRNVEAVHERLLHRGGSLAAEDVGGTMPRTMLLDVASGRVLLKNAGREWSL
jgi:chemotaxis protein CheD